MGTKGGGVRSGPIGQRSLQPRLALEILQARGLRRIGNTDVGHPADTSGFGGLEQRQCVFHRTRMLEVSVVEAYPVRVVEDRGSAQRLRQLYDIVEVKGMGLD